jgi:RNA-directed DNA polymerase
MSLDLILPKERLQYLINSAPYRYKVYSVDKRSGLGKRVIAQPAKEVKRLQYWVIKNIFPRLNVHPSAMAYVARKNIRDNTTVHARQPYLLKLDFKDFFPSIKGSDFLQYARENENLHLDELELQGLVRILFWWPKTSHQLQLSIGAPSSPYFSNAIMYRFDSEIEQYCMEKGIIYTRYADDMTFSMHDKVMRGKTFEKVQAVLDNLPFPKLELNNKKTIFGSKAHRRMVTGLILSNDGKISLGREKKRRIRAQIHQFVTGRMPFDEQCRLRGMLAFARDIEPDFVIRMEQKYGSEVVRNIGKN